MATPALGLSDDEVTVVDYVDSWPTSFEALAAPLRDRLPEARVEHMGSTSIPGLPAKPLIDISVGLPPAASLPVALAEECGLSFRGVNPESVLFAIFESPGYRLANVHFRYAGAESERWDLLFRDFLRAHPVVARQYGDAKRRAAEAVDRRGRAAYSDTKAPFIRSLVGEIESWAVAMKWQLPN